MAILTTSEASTAPNYTTVNTSYFTVVVAASSTSSERASFENLLPIARAMATVEVKGDFMNWLGAQ